MRLPHGTEVVVVGGCLERIVDRNGALHADLAWNSEGLAQLSVIGARVSGEVVEDPLLGRAHRIDLQLAGTTMSALDWKHPAEIPTVADPGRLPPGAGGAILNTLAWLARLGGRVPLRYAGPYPTPALFRALARSFSTTATEAEFTADLHARASRLARDPIPIEFAPDPCERVAIIATSAGPRSAAEGRRAGSIEGWVELRRGLERVVHRGVTYEGVDGIARLVDGSAEVWFGDTRYARVATCSPTGELLDGPHAIPACTSAAIGQAFPPPLRAALAELVAEAVPAPLAAAAHAIVVARPIAWADLGARAARATSTGFEVHAAIWDRVAPSGLARVALAIAEALAPVVTSTVIAAISPSANRVHFAP